MALRKLPSDVRGEDQKSIVLGQRRREIADEDVAVQIGGNRRMKAMHRNEFAQGRAPHGERSEELTEGPGLDFQLGYAGTFSGDAQKFNVHDGSKQCLTRPSQQGKGG